MTTKPKARKFRIRRNDGGAPTGETRNAETARAETNGSPGASHPSPEELLAMPENAEDGFGDMALPGSAAANRRQASGNEGAEARPSTPSVEQELAAIRAEGLTGRQLRMARRTAQKHGLQPSSDFDAVRILRNRGIDPFGQSNMLELVVNEKGGAGGDAPRQTLPVRAETAQMPARTAPPPMPGK